jgi:Na+-transporting methylmalonyl-CoA/oxaloacetate decarboxylase gamma subunit
VSSPIGDGLGTRKGCRTLVYLAVGSVLLVLTLLAAAITAISLAAHAGRHPQPTPSTSTRSTP